jgi:hypothetical protein
MRHLLSRSALALFVAGSLAAGGLSSAQQQDPTFSSTQEQANTLPPGQFPAVLKSKQVDFTYRSTHSVLACDELRNRVATILREVGARDDVQVSARECDLFVTPSARGPRTSDPRVSGTIQPGSGGDLTGNNDPFGSSPINRQMERRETLTHGDQYDRYKSQTTPVHIEVMMPVVITPEILEEVERDKSRRALISRVQGNQAAVNDDPIYFPAARREVTLSHDTIELEPIDCELLEQMRRTVFRQLDVKVTSGALSCDSSSFIKPKLTVETLLPVGYEMPGERRKRQHDEKAAQSKEPAKPSQ